MERERENLLNMLEDQKHQILSIIVIHAQGFVAVKNMRTCYKQNPPKLFTRRLSVR